MFAPIGRRVELFAPLPRIKSPVLVTGDKALKAALAVVCPVPPLAIATVPVTFDAVPVVFWLKVGHVNVPVLKLPDCGVPRIGVVKLGDVASATTVPEPVVEYDVPQAVPVELGMPAPG